MATHLCANQGTKSEQMPAGQGHQQESAQTFCLRILTNTSSHCFANATMLALTWQTVLMWDFFQCSWKVGEPLFRTLTALTPLPMSLVHHPEFVAMMGDEWHDFDVQQDSNQFLTILLQIIQPSHMSCRWLPRLLHCGECGDTHLSAEKGTRWHPIHLNTHAVSMPACALQFLIDTWHDHQGLCRLLSQPSPAIVLVLDRCSDMEDNKSVPLQVVNFAEPFQMPYFHPGTEDIVHCQFWPIAVTFHLGDLRSGHYICGIRTKQGWKVYDDSKVPVLESPFMMQPHRKLTQVWAINALPWND